MEATASIFTLMMKVIYLFILFISLSTNALAARVVLMSSLDTPRIWYHKKDWEIERPLKKIFKKHFEGSGYEVVIKEKVDQVTLWKELQNPENLAIFWVSHAKGQAQIGAGINSESAVVDYYGNDVKDLFKTVHKNLRYLGVVGCNAKEMLESFTKNGYYKNNKKLVTHSFDKKVEVRRGLRRSIKYSANALGHYKNTFGPGGRIDIESELLEDFQSYNNENKDSKFFEINYERFSQVDSESVAIKVNGLVLDVLESQKAGELSKGTLKLPHDLDPRKITVDSNRFYSNKKLDLGEFIFVSREMSWKPFAKRDGTPIGATRNIYRLKK